MSTTTTPPRIVDYLAVRIGAQYASRVAAQARASAKGIADYGEVHRLEDAAHVLWADELAAWDRLTDDEQALAFDHPDYHDV